MKMPNSEIINEIGLKGYNTIARGEAPGLKMYRVQP